MSSEPHPLKKFGQHFLSNPITLQRMLDEISPAPDESFIEIGPGTGALTLPLSELCQSVISLEVDKRMLEFLSKNITEHSNIHLVKADALKDDIPKIINSVDPQDNKNYRLVGNLPYNISVHLIEKFLLLTNFKEIGDGKDNKDNPDGKHGEDNNTLSFKDMHFLVQKEIAQRLFAEVGDSNYGRLSIMAWTLAKGCKMFNLPPNDFSPPPKVTSSFIQMQPQLHPSFSQPNSGLKKLRIFNQLVTAAFSRPNRRMRNNLKNHDNIMAALLQLNLADKRARETSPEDFISVTNLIDVE